MSEDLPLQQITSILCDNFQHITNPSSNYVMNCDSKGFGNWGVGGGSGTVTNISTGTGLSGGPITGTGTISLANTTVTPASYTNANITVDAQGRITSATNGTTNPGTVTNISTGTGLSGGPITGTGTISLANTTVTPASYTNANITVDAQGRITLASNGVNMLGAGAYGEVYSITYSDTINTGDTLITGLTTGLCSGITPSTDGLTVTSNGIYQLSFTYDGALNANNKTITITIYVNGTPQTKATGSVHHHHHQHPSADGGSSVNCLLSINNGQKLSVYMKVSGGSSVTLTAHKISVVLVKIA